MELLIQYFKKGFEFVARNRKRWLCKIKVVIFQLIINMPVAIPVIAAPPAFTLPKYSGARNKAFAPNNFIKLPVIVKKRISQKIRSTWDFLK
jgi:hypothetical protein